MMKNIIMDEEKYFNIIDFSFSINYSDKNNKKHNMITYNMVTPPEMFFNSEYDYNSDYYRLGSIIYYLIFKTYPYTIKKKKNKTDIFINYKNIKNYTCSCIDFLNKLLISDYSKRIGFKNINELVNHNWFKGFNWTKLEERQIKSPYQFIKNEYNNLFCSKFIFPIKYITKFKMKFKNIIYSQLIKNFDFVNLLVIKKIINVNNN